MTSFSNYLENYMTANHFTVLELSKMIGMERSTVYKYVHGSRLPANRKMVTAIGENLRMPVSVLKELLICYEYSRLGEETFYSYQCITDIIGTIGNDVSETDDKNGIKTIIGDIKNGMFELKSQEQIAENVKFCFALAESRDQQVKIIMQPKYEIINYIMKSALVKGKVNTEQLICLNTAQEKGSHYNLHTLKCVLPMLLSGNYDLLFYYGNVSEHINEMTMIPNMILLDDTVLLFDYSMQRGVLCNLQEFVNGCLDDYNRKKEKCKKIGFRTNNLMECFGVFAPTHNQKTSRWNIHCCPCLGLCLSEDILREVVYEDIPMREEVIQGLLQANGSWVDGKHTPFDIPVFSVFSKKGVEDFLDTGRITDYPKNYYRPISRKWRKILLERMFVLKEQNIMKYYLAKEDTFYISPDVVICIENNKSIIFFDFQKDDTIILNLTEPSIGNCFSEFVQYLIDCEMIYSEQETMDFVREVLDQYEV